MPTATDVREQRPKPVYRFAIAGALLIAAMVAATVGVARLGVRVNQLRNEAARLETDLDRERAVVQQQRETLQKEIASLEERRLQLRAENDQLAEVNRQLRAVNPAAAAATERRLESQQRLNPRVYLQVADDKDLPVAARVTAALRKAGFTVPEIERVKAGPRQPQVRYFRAEDADEAKRVVQTVKNDVPNITLQSVSGDETSTRIRPGHLEIWF
jgi:septal ring factor EnvC (AmiA/AmiB activator)